METTFRFKHLWESHFSQKSQVKKNVNLWPRTILPESFVPEFLFYSQDKYFLANPIWRKNQINYFKAELQPILLFFDVNKWPSARFSKRIDRYYCTPRSTTILYTKCIDQIFENIAPNGLWVTYCTLKMSINDPVQVFQSKNQYFLAYRAVKKYGEPGVSNWFFKNDF